jgi:hypothetical protein
MLGLESSVMARDRQGSSNVACAAASLRPVPPGGRADHRSHRGHPRIGLPGPSSADGQRRRAHDQQRSGPEPGTTMAVPSWRRGPRGSGLSCCGLPRHVAACSRRGARSPGLPARPGGSARTRRGGTTPTGCPGREPWSRTRRPSRLRVAGRTQTSSGRPHCRGVRWPRGHAASAWRCLPAWWVGRSLAPGQGR